MIITGWDDNNNQRNKTENKTDKTKLTGEITQSETKQNVSDNHNYLVYS